jgi:hypothetical protein
LISSVSTLGKLMVNSLTTHGQRGVPSPRKLTRSHLSSFCRDFPHRSTSVAVGRSLPALHDKTFVSIFLLNHPSR